MNKVTLRSHGFLIAALIFAADQWSKVWALQMAETGDLPLYLTPFLNIILAGNAGVSFGMLHAQNVKGVFFLILLGIALSLLIFYWLWKSDNYLASLSLGGILGGALGNIYDRIQFGKVIDFIDFHVWGYHWYTFNVADCGIVLGAALCIGQEFYTARKRA